MPRSSTLGRTLAVHPRLAIPLDEFEFTFVRSSGPGGQNVNKVNTKAQLRWPVLTSPSLSQDLRERFLTKYRRRVTAAGELVISSQRYRDQVRNVDDCLAKVSSMLLEVASPAVPRKSTRPPRKAIENRLNNKRKAASKKRDRRQSPLNE